MIELSGTWDDWIRQSMNHTRLTHKNTGLLVSVRSVEEARIAVDSNCVSIIDLKEPINGSLGCVSIQSAREVLDCLPSNTMSSIAIGEVVDWPIWATSGSESRNEVLAQFDFVKIGLAGIASRSDWVRRWQDCLAELPGNVQRVAVAYADSDRAGSPSVQSIVESAVEVGCSLLLIDTFCKQHGGLLNLLSIEALTEIVSAARTQGLKIVLAGSLDVASIETLGAIEPNFFAVRGDVCGAARTSTIEPHKIVELGAFVNDRIRSRNR